MQFIKIIMLVLVLSLATLEQAQAQTLPPQPAGIAVTASALAQQGSNYSSVITVTVTDEKGNPSPGANVYFDSSKGNLSTLYSTVKGWMNITDSSGKTTAILTLSSSERVTVTATVGSVPAATITVGQEPATVSVTAKPAQTVVSPPLPTQVKPGTTPEITETEETPEVTATIEGTIKPDETEAVTPRVTATRSTSGFELAFSIISLVLIYTYIRRK